MTGYKIEGFRGLLKGSANEGTTYLELVEVVSGWELYCKGIPLVSLRGGVRVFRNAQSAIMYVKNNLVPSFSGKIVIQIAVS